MEDLVYWTKDKTECIAEAVKAALEVQTAHRRMITTSVRHTAAKQTKKRKLDAAESDCEYVHYTVTPSETSAWY
jgi:hypothetical protein